MSLACGGASPAIVAFPETLPAHGGADGRIAGRPAELVVHASGEVFLYVAEASAVLEGWAVSLYVGERALGLTYRGPGLGFVGRFEPPLAAPPIPANVLIVRPGGVSRGRFVIRRVLPAPTHGGAVLARGDVVVEVTVHADGEVSVLAREGSIARLRGPVLSVEGADGHRYPIALVLDPETGSLRGGLSGFTPRAGRVELWAETAAGPWVAEGLLAEVVEAVAWPDGAEGSFQLELPELGSEVPGVIVVPPPGEEPAAD